MSEQNFIVLDDYQDTVNGTYILFTDYEEAVRAAVSRLRAVLDGEEITDFDYGKAEESLRTTSEYFCERKLSGGFQGDGGFLLKISQLHKQQKENQ